MTTYHRSSVCRGRPGRPLRCLPDEVQTQTGTGVPIITIVTVGAPFFCRSDGRCKVVFKNHAGFNLLIVYIVFIVCKSRCLGSVLKDFGISERVKAMNSWEGQN